MLKLYDKMTHEMLATDPKTSSPEVEDVFSYKLLSGHYRTDGTYKSGDQLRTEYVGLTDRLIQRMVDGIDVVNTATGEAERERE